MIKPYIEGEEINYRALIARGEELFDFPCSASWRGYYEERYYTRPEPFQQPSCPPQPVRKAQQNNSQLYKVIDQQRAEIRSLENKLNEHIDASKRARSDRL